MSSRLLTAHNERGHEDVPSPPSCPTACDSSTSVVEGGAPAPALAPVVVAFAFASLNTFAIWLATRRARACCPAPVPAGLGEVASDVGAGAKSDDDGSLGTGTRAALVNGTSRGRAPRRCGCDCPSSPLFPFPFETPLVPLRRLIARVACWMTASASCVRVDEFVASDDANESTERCSCSRSPRCTCAGTATVLRGTKSARRRGIDRPSVDDDGESVGLVSPLGA